MAVIFRRFRKQPIVCVAVLVTIGVAVATNTALFSVFDGLLFRPLPYKDADRIVHMEVQSSTRLSLPREGVVVLTERAATTNSLTARADARPVTLFDPTGVATLEWQIRAIRVSPSLFTLLGVRPVLGRVIQEHDLHDPRYVVLLGYDLWKARFGADPSIIGRSVEIPGASLDTRWRVVGVMPEGFSFPEGANFWIPSYAGYPSPAVMPYARLSEGVTTGALRAELAGVSVTPLRERVRPRGAVALGVLLVASGLLLLLAFVQVSALMLAQAASRITDIGVRLALGASRLQLAGHFALEGGLLVGLALGLATLLSPAITALIVRALPAEITRGQYLDPDIRAFMSAAGFSMMGLLVLTMVPIDLIRRSSPLTLLRGRALGDLRARATRVRNGLFVAQLAIVTLLVYLTALMFSSYVRTLETDVGFDPTDLVAIRMPRGDGLVSGGPKAQLNRQRALVAETIAVLRTLHGVRAVAGAHFWPMQRDGLRPDSLPTQSDPNRFPTPGRYGVISPGFPAVLGLELISGAEPVTAELEEIGARSPPGEQLALANVALARELEPFGPPVGQLVAGRFRIVGVVPDVKLERPDRAAEPTLFHYLHPPGQPAVVLVRLEPGRSAEAVGIPTSLARIWGAHAARPVSIEDAIDLATSDHRARVFLLGLISSLTIPLAFIGVVGALTLDVTERTRDIAVHLALGAPAGFIERRVALRAVQLTAIAMAIGLSIAMGLNTVMRAALLGVATFDARALLVSMGLVLTVVWMAALIPARRASRINPIDALRES